jgi:hypothetical protein
MNPSYIIALYLHTNIETKLAIINMYKINI